MIVLIFKVGDDTLAMDTGRVVEIVPLLTVRKVPHMPDHVLGIMNYRGTMTPVIDLSLLHCGRPSRMVLSTRIVIVRLDPANGTERMIGLAGERMTGTIRARREDFQPPGVQSETSRYLGDILVGERETVQLVEPEAILTPEVFELLTAGDKAGTSRRKARGA